MKKKYNPKFNFANKSSQKEDDLDLKIDFVTIVNVNLPSGAQSDND